MRLHGGPMLLLASLLCGLGCAGSLSSAHATGHDLRGTAVGPRRRAAPGGACVPAFAAVPGGTGPAAAAGVWAGRPRSACAAGGALRLVCLNNESRRPKRDDRFVLPHSRFEGKFVPIQEQMTFQAEMEALDGLDEAERSMEAGANEHDKFDKQGDVTFGLRIEMSAGFSKKSVEARSRWKCPEYREKVIRKREDGPDAHLPAAGAPSVQNNDAALPSGLPRLHDLLQSDIVSWRPDDGGWAGTETLLRTEKMQKAARRGAASKTPLARGGGDVAPDAGEAAKKGGAKGGAGGRSKAMQKKVQDLKLLHSDQNAWMAQRLSTENALPVRGSLEWRLVRQARYKEGARKRMAKKSEGGKTSRAAASVKEEEQGADAAKSEEVVAPAARSRNASPSVRKIVASLKPKEPLLAAATTLPVAQEARQKAGS